MNARVRHTCALLAVAASAMTLGAVPDPMRPGGYSGAAVSALGGAQVLRLQAIIGDENFRLAIINGQVLRVGESVAGATVLAISATSVSYGRKQQRGVLQLPAIIRIQE